MAGKRFENREQLKTYLAEIRETETNIRMEMTRVRENIESISEALARRSLHALRLDYAGGKGTPDQDALFHALMAAERDVEKQEYDACLTIRTLEEESGRIRLVYDCIRRLSFNEAGLIRILYLEKLSLEAAAERYGLSKSTVYKRQNAALDHLLNICNAAMDREERKCVSSGRIRAGREEETMAALLPAGTGESSYAAAPGRA